MNKKAWLIGGLVGLVLGYLIGQFVPPRNPGTLSLESGTYCCDRIDIAQKCIKKVTACPVDKPITVPVP